ncbi:hypothetical protein [Gemmata sp.]|uniref:hypothetical protein n=1 Tax=Gemmata sp. TaxID=1914242 RepID=UPI003F70194C
MQDTTQSDTSHHPAEDRRQKFPRRPEANPPGTFLGCPTYIRAHCRTAARGGSSGYGEAGFHLGHHVRELEPHDTEQEAWAGIIESELAPLVAAGDDASALAWLVRRYPRVMANVPTRRRSNFLAGFYRGFAKAAE